MGSSSTPLRICLKTSSAPVKFYTYSCIKQYYPILEVNVRYLLLKCNIAHSQHFLSSHECVLNAFKAYLLLYNNVSLKGEIQVEM